MDRDAQLCSHANEVPSVCSCYRGCYCKSHTCRVKDDKPGIVPEWAGMDDFPGSDYDGPDQYTLFSKLVDSRQPDPIPNNSPLIKDLVAKDFAERAEFGKYKYGVYLQANNGRDALKDLYQEQLDAIMYTRLLIYQRDGK